MSTAREARQSGTPHGNDARTPFQVDRDRILYSMPFRRLAGVTQVVSPDEGEIFHNRLTHSLKVAQVARRLAEKLQKDCPDEVEAWGGIDPDVVEAAALAHDLGHPPFGHVAERALDVLVSNESRLCPDDTAKKRRFEGYEGNAQSFRIVTELAVRRSSSTYGLDLTRATLSAILKYPWKWSANPENPAKYGAYECDAAAFDFARAALQPRGPRPAVERSLEAQIMDWSDDITYSVHDTEDFYRAGLIPLDRLAVPSPERERYFLRVMQGAREEDLDVNSDFHSIFANLFDTLTVNAPYEGTRDQQRELANFVSTNVNRFVVNTRVLPPPGNNGEAIGYPDEIRLQVFFLKQLLWTYVIDNPALAAHRLGQRRAIATLFAEFSAAIDEQRWSVLPTFFRERARDLHEQNTEAITTLPEKRARLVADTISSMTDGQALLVYQQFTGISASSMRHPVVG
jgi:dGTPase